MREVKDLVITILQFIAVILVVFLVYEMVLYIGVRYSKPENFQPFELATVTALIGGFALVGGFSSNSRLAKLAFSLRKIGSLYIVATIAFFIFGLSLPLTDKTLDAILISQAIPVVVGSFYIGAFLFAIATGWLIYAIPRLFKEN